MKKTKKAKSINLGLQGGGSHGAFTWGVLDYLLEDGRLDIEGISATSAGSMNAVVYAYGMMKGGKDGAREALEKFWASVSATGRWIDPVQVMPWDKIRGNWDPTRSPGYMMFEYLTRTFSPYEINPFNINPLQQLLAKEVNFDELGKYKDIQLFINATNVRTGRIKVFRNNELTCEAVMASACLPHFFQAVQIGDDFYWDGGYRGNPSIFPLIYCTESRDVVVIHVNPIELEELPRTSAQINDRLNSITFNGALLSEFRAIAFVTKLIEDGWIKDEYKGRLKHMLMHAIRADQSLSDLTVASKLVTDWDFLIELRDRGRRTCAQWIQQNFDAIGERSSVNLEMEFLGDGVRSPNRS